MYMFWFPSFRHIKYLEHNITLLFEISTMLFAILHALSWMSAALFACFPASYVFKILKKYFFSSSFEDLICEYSYKFTEYITYDWYCQSSVLKLIPVKYWGFKSIIHINSWSIDHPEI